MSWRTKGVVAGLTAAAAVLRLIGLDDGLWYDEIVTIVESVRLPLMQVVTTYHGSNDHPLYTLLAHLSVSAFGETPWALRLPAALAGIVTIPAVVWAGRRVTTTAEALWAAALLTVSAQHVWFSQDARGYSLLALVFLLSGALLMDAIDTGRRARYLAYGAVVAIGMATHLTMAFVAAGHALACAPLVLRRQVRLRYLIEAWAIVAVVAALVYLPAVSAATASFETSSGTAAEVATYRWAILQALERLGNGTGWLGLVVLALLGGLGAISYTRQSWWLAAISGLPAILLAAALAVLHQPVRPRFFFFLIGPAALLLVRGATVASAALAPRARRAVPLALVAIVALPLSAAYGPKQDFDAAKRYVERLHRDGEPVVTAGLATLPYSRYYALPWRGVERNSDLVTIKSGHERVWIVYTFLEYVTDRALQATVTAACRGAARFAGTIGGGDIRVCLLDRASDGGIVPASQTSPGGETPMISIDPAIVHQTITGWEATAEAGQVDSPAFLAYRHELFDRAVNDLGITRLRLEVRSGAEHAQDNWSAWRAGRLTDAAWRSVRYATVNDNASPDALDTRGFWFSELDDTVEKVVLPFKAHVEEAGRQLHLNVNYVAFTGQITGGQYQHDNPEEYAEFVEATLTHLRQRWGLTPDSWEMVLEPDNSRQWHPAALRAAMLATERRLRSRGIELSLIAPSTTSMREALSYAVEIARGGAPSFWRELSYHRYTDVSMPTLDALRQQAQVLGLRTSMLEHIGSGYEDLHEDLATGSVSAWQQFTLAYPGDAGDGANYFGIDDRNPGAPRVTMPLRTALLRQYFRYIQSGAVRIGTISNDPAWDAVAFVNPDGGHVVVIKADRRGSIVLHGLPPGSYRGIYTTAADVGVPLRETIVTGAAPSVTIVMPDAGVFTLYSTG